MIASIVWPLLVYWVILFVCLSIIVEFAQPYFYDERTPAAGLKTAAGSFLLAALLTYTRSSFDTMFTDKLPMTVLQAIAWFAVFTLVLRFHPPHAAAIGIVAMVIITGMASICVDSLTSTNRQTIDVNRRPSRPLRQPASPSLVSPARIKPAGGTGAAKAP